MAKPVVFLGDSLRRLKGFPEPARRQAGTELRIVQHGGEPTDWKSMPSVGRGVREIRIRETSGAYRVIYLATRAEAIYVLHAFEKKSQSTPRHDIELARRRLQAL